MSGASEADKRRLHAQIDVARRQIGVHRDRLAQSTDEAQKNLIRGTLKGEESKLANLESQLKD